MNGKPRHHRTNAGSLDPWFTNYQVKKCIRNTSTGCFWVQRRTKDSMSESMTLPERQMFEVGPGCHFSSDGT
eukprot:474106-Amphidinium_carterae.1